jgi:4-amino-4-deoxy-L-arabinose transferase-like glycosyltransferase
LSGFNTKERFLAFSFAAMVLVLALFSGLAAIGLVGPDEPRYAWIAREMAQSGDWVTPRLYGQAWFEKPALYYWAAAIGFKMFRSAEWAARMSSAFAALCAALTISWLALKHYGEKTAWVSLLIFSTTIGALAFARAATPDMLFAASLTIAMACADTVLREHGALRSSSDASQAEPRARLASTIFFGAWLGVAALAKGPGAVALAGGSIALWVICARQWRAALRLAHPAAIGAFVVVAVPWYALCAMRNPDFLRTFLFLHNVQRYLTPVFQHRQPFWFFGPILLIALLPWSVLLFAVAAEGLRLWKQKTFVDSPGFFFACWAIFPIAFFSLSQSKLPGYILPAVPPLALLCAVALERRIAAGESSRAWMLVAIAATVLALYLAAPLVAQKQLPDLWASQNWHARGRIFQFYGAIVFVASLLFIFVRYPRLALSSICASGLFLAVMANDTLRIAETRSDDQFSARRVAASKQLQPPFNNDPIALYKVHRNWEFGLNFYLGRAIPEWTPQIDGPAVVFTSPSGLLELEKQASVTSVQEFGIPKCVKAAVERPLP